MIYKRGQGPVARVQIYVVVLVGGKGKRLRPLSSDARPKAFLSVTCDRKTMFRKTLDRARKLVHENNILVVANKDHRSLVKSDFLKIKKENMLLEPVSRNTAPAITLAANELQRRHDDAVMVVLPTDQYIADEKKYLDSVKNGIGFAKTNEALVVLGVKPGAPSTQFGYVRVKGPVARVQGILKVEKFTEKPDLKTAKRYLKSGKYLWNTGAFIFKVSAFLRAVKKFAPVMYNNIKNYTRVPDISIDYAIMEKAPNIFCASGKYRWQDMGSFESLAKILRRESRQFIVDGEERITKII